MFRQVVVRAWNLSKVNHYRGWQPSDLEIGGRVKQIIAGNWKMNLTVAESVRLASCLVEQLSAAQQAGEFDPETVEVVVAPTNVALHAVAQALIGSPVSVSGQDCHFETKGAFTGENSPSHLRAAGAQYCLVGHSEGVSSLVSPTRASQKDEALCSAKGNTDRMRGGNPR